MRETDVQRRGKEGHVTEKEAPCPEASTAGRNSRPPLPWNGPRCERSLAALRNCQADRSLCSGVPMRNHGGEGLREHIQVSKWGSPTTRPSQEGPGACLTPDRSWHDRDAAIAPVMYMIVLLF